MDHNIIIRWQQRHPLLFGLITGIFGLNYLLWYQRKHCPVCGHKLEQMETPCPGCHNPMTWVCDYCNKERCEHIIE
jgi:predicted amidophosphoribosyltransferase